MPQKKNNFSDDLEQIHKRLTEHLDDLDEIKERYAGSERDDIEQIQNRTIAAINEIDAIRDRHTREDSPNV